MNSLDLIKEKFKNDNFANNFGVVLEELTEDSVKMYMKLTPEMNNFNGRPHGGAIYGLADAAFSVIGNNKNNMSVALDCNIYYHASPEPGLILRVKGQLIKQTRNNKERQEIITDAVEKFIESATKEKIQRESKKQP